MKKDFIKKDFAPWLLLPGIVLALSSVTLLAPHQSASAAAPTAAAKPQAAPQTVAYDDGDGDELLEHWGDPRYSREERRQMAGIAGGFLMLGVFAYRRRTLKKRRCEIVPMPTEADFLKWDSRKAA